MRQLRQDKKEAILVVDAIIAMWQENDKNNKVEHNEEEAGDLQQQQVEVEVPVDEHLETVQKDNNDADNKTEHDPNAAITGLFKVLGPSYARNTHFFQALLCSSTPLGIFMGLVALGFFNAYTELADLTWHTDVYQQALAYNPETSTNTDVLDPVRFGNGEWWYVGLLAVAGLAIGTIKTVWTLCVPTEMAFPQKPPGFLEDLQGLKAHNVLLPIPMLACSAISIGLGAVCGPEAALGAAGTAAGNLVARNWGGWSSMPMSIFNCILPDLSNQSEMCALDGIGAAFGSLFPAQYMSPMLMLELGGHWGVGGKFSVAETLARSGLAATIGYAVFTGLEDRTLLQQSILPSTVYNEAPTVSAVDLFTAACLGLICGAVGLVGFLCLAIGGALGKFTCAKFNDLGKLLRLPETFQLGLLLTPVVGGALVGFLSVATPLILSDGSQQIGPILAMGSELGAATVAATGLFKLLAVGLSLGFGFIGGQVFPLLFSGICTGLTAHLVYTDIPLLVAVPSCMVAVPCAFLPAILTMTTLASMVFVLGGAATSPVFVACIFSYSTVCGMGFVQNILTKALAKGKEKERASTARASTVSC